MKCGHLLKMNIQRGASNIVFDQSLEGGEQSSQSSKAKSKQTKDMKVVYVLRDINKALVAAWKKEFEKYSDQVQVCVKLCHSLFPFQCSTCITISE